MFSEVKPILPRKVQKVVMNHFRQETFGELNQNDHNDKDSKDSFNDRHDL